MITINLKLCGHVIIQIGFSAYPLQGHNLSPPACHPPPPLASVYSKRNYRHKHVKCTFHCQKKSICYDTRNIRINIACNHLPSLLKHTGGFRFSLHLHSAGTLLSPSAQKVGGTHKRKSSSILLLPILDCL